MNIIEQLEREEVARLAKTIPDFEPGDTLIVNVRVKEGERTRVQAYEGVCIARSGGGLNETSRFARSLTAKAWSASSRCIRR